MSDEPVRYGIIGSGMMGLEHLWNLHHVPGAAVTAIADPNAPSREATLAFDEGRSQITEFDDHRELLASGLVDVVIVSTPNMTHRAILDDVLTTDLHLLVEKPLCTTVSDCRAVLAAAEARRDRGCDAVIWVGLEYRYMPPVARLLREVHAGTVGPPKMVAIREHRFPFLQKVGDWNRFNRNTGGTLVEKCCHFFDLMNHITGDRPVRVQASGAQDVNHLDERYDGEVPDILDNAFVIVEFRNGVRGSLDLCMFAEGGRYEQELTVVGDLGKLETTVPGDTVWHGERPAVGSSPSGAVAVAAPLADEVRYTGFHHGSSFREHLRFIEQIRSGGDALVTVDDGLWSVAMGAAAHRAIEEGRVVDLAEWDLP